MSKLSYFDRLSTITDNKPKIAATLEAKLVRDHAVPEAVARAAAAGAVAISTDGDYEENGAMKSDAFDRAHAHALTDRNVKAALELGARAANMGKPGHAPDGRAFHELSTNEILLLDAKNPATAGAREHANNPHKI